MNDNIYTMIDDMIKYDNITHFLFYGTKNVYLEKYVKYIISKCYTSSKEINEYVMSMNCAEGKGIHCIRDGLKYFAQSICSVSKFKTIVLYNVDYLTSDAQSALRRIIELYSHSTRFISTAHKKETILNPILSRFYCIYVPYEDEIIIDKSYTAYINRQKRLLLHKEWNNINENTIEEKVTKFYSKGVHTKDILDYIVKEKISDIEIQNQIEWLYELHRVHIRDDRILMICILREICLKCKKPFH